MQNTNVQFDPRSIGKVLAYIDAQWQELERFVPQDNGTLVGLPYPYYVPSTMSVSGFVYEELYYWDSYFVAQGLISSGRIKEASGLLDDLVALADRFGMVPNGSRFYLTSRSQPPLMTSFIMDLYQYKRSKRWLAAKMRVAQDEYWKVWRGTQQPFLHQVHEGLSRYYDANVLHELAECESGWDMTTRFDYRCLDFLPIDLNALLYKYERDFAESALILGKPQEAAEWKRRAEVRCENINKYLWDDGEGFFFDYDYRSGERSKVFSLAGFYPLWAGMVSREQAARMMKNLSKFEQAGGLTATAKFPRVEEHVPSQWTYPNGWAPLQFLTIRGLADYGYELDAERLARKWLHTNLQGFQQSGVLYEKYNVVELDQPPKEGVYPSQVGFGWTNAVFISLAKEYLYAHEQPEPVRSGSKARTFAGVGRPLAAMREFLF